MVMAPRKDLVSIEFTQHCDRYNGGEIAGFPKHIAKNFIKLGVAKLVMPALEKEVMAAQPPKDDHPAAERGKRPRSK